VTKAVTVIVLVTVTGLDLCGLFAQWEMTPESGRQKEMVKKRKTNK